jgi:TonB family protein
VQGAVTLEYTVDTEGGVVAVKVATSSGHGDLDEAAVDAVKSRKYKPAVQAGIPRNYRKRETFRFSLD